MKPGFYGGVLVGFLVAAASFSWASSQFLQYLKKHHPEARFFAIDGQERKTQLSPLDENLLSTAQVASWLSTAVMEIYSFNSNDYEEKLKESSRHFSRHGWESFTVYLQDTNLIERATSSQQMVMSLGEPKLIEEGPHRGKYRWIFNYPILLTFQQSDQVLKDEKTLRITVMRNHMPGEKVIIEEWETIN